MVCWGGIVAEKILLGRASRCWTKGSHDRQAADLGARLLGKKGRAVAAYVASFEPEARRVLERRWAEVQALARALLRRRRR